VAGFCAKVIDLMPSKEERFLTRAANIGNSKLFRISAADVILEMTKTENRRRGQQSFFERKESVSAKIGAKF
jgi:hypothetical protein